MIIPEVRLDAPSAAPSDVIVRGDALAGAWFSADERFRYVLRRTWNSKRPPLTVCMLNPSTADERVVDPTVRKCLHFAQRDDYGGLIVTNLFAIRATDPAVLKAAVKNGKLDDLVGPHNDAILRQLPKLPFVIAAWGASKWKFVEARAGVVRAMRADWQCFGTSKDGCPRHPCYLANDTKIVPWSPHDRIGNANA